MDTATVPVLPSYTFLIPLLPALGAVILGLWGSRLDKRAVSWIACSTVFVSFVLSFASFLLLHHMPEDALAIGNWKTIPHQLGPGWEQTLWTWFSAADTTMQPDTHTIGIANFLNVPFGFLMDPLSAVMLLFVAGIGFLIHVYSTGYMAGDPGYHRFFAYLNLFMASMLMLVLGSSVLTLFIGWEGVGLCSYLLIGFWWREAENHNPQPAVENVRSANKAFIVNRVGDFSFLVGIALLLWLTWAWTGGVAGNEDGWTTLTFTQMRAHAATYAAMEAQPITPFGLHLGFGAVTLVCLLFFIGATGKSAQIPLYVWLPDAMAGPTPVSALIHAATMVTAGVYMICRLNFLYVLAPTALAVVAIVGVATAFFAATIGLFQYDIKRVLAYSTISQLGYMFVGVGTAFFSVGLFHVFTHAFFKALLFLGAGSIIHAMHHVLPHDVDPQDMRHMGGLRKFMPATYWTFAAAWLAIVGFPFLAGFWSKDEVLWKAMENSLGTPHAVALWGEGGAMPIVWKIIWAVGFITAALTVIYMSRLFYRVFHGTYMGRKIAEDHAKTHGHGHGHVHDPQESPGSMTLPLSALAVGAVVAGFWNLPGWVHDIPGIGKYLPAHRFTEFLEPAFRNLAATTAEPPHEAQAALDTALGGSPGHILAAAEAGAHGAEHAGHFGLEMGLLASAIVMVLVLLYFSRGLYVKRLDVLAGWYEDWRNNPVYLLVYRKYRIDELYNATIVAAVMGLKEVVAWFDRTIIDGILHLMARILLAIRWMVGAIDIYLLDGEAYGERHGLVDWITRGMARTATSVRRLQSGDIQRYLRGIAIAVAIGTLLWLGMKIKGS